MRPTIYIPSRLMRLLALGAEARRAALPSELNAAEPERLVSELVETGSDWKKRGLRVS